MVQNQLSKKLSLVSFWTEFTILPKWVEFGNDCVKTFFGKSKNYKGFFNSVAVRTAVVVWSIAIRQWMTSRNRDWPTYLYSIEESRKWWSRETHFLCKYPIHHIILLAMFYEFYELFQLASPANSLKINFLPRLPQKL